MNTIQAINTTSINYNPLDFQNQRVIGSTNKASNASANLPRDLSLVSYIGKSATTSSTKTGELTMRNINNTVALVQSIDSAASAIEDKLFDMNAIAMQETQCACQQIRTVQESIKDIANDFSWNGTNFMVGGGENDQTTTLLSYNLNIEKDPDDSLRIDFKSFNPMSAVDTDGVLNPTEPNFPDLNKSAGTDTHAYGNAALYSSLDEDNYLHIHSDASRVNAIAQISRAIDGVIAERLRLSQYITKLSLISENQQKERSDSNLNIAQVENSEHALRIAELSRTDITQKSSLAMLAQANQPASQMWGLLQ